MIDAIDTRIDTASRSFKVRGFIKNADRSLPAGMFMHVTIGLKESDALVVPEEALMIDQGQPFVFRLNPAKDPDLFSVEKRAVSIGRRGFGFVELTDGITPGDEVVTRGTQKVRPGSIVKKRDLASMGNANAGNSANTGS